MADVSSFDVTSTVDLQEVDNAVNQARKEIAQRYDFKGSTASIDFNKAESTLTLAAEDQMKMTALWDVLQTRMVRRNVPVKNLKLGDIETASGASVRRVDHAAARDSKRCRAGHHQISQGSEAQEGAGQHSGRPAPHLVGIQRRAAGRHPPAPRATTSASPSSSAITDKTRSAESADRPSANRHARIQKRRDVLIRHIDRSDILSSYQSDSPILSQ